MGRGKIEKVSEREWERERGEWDESEKGEWGERKKEGRVRWESEVRCGSDVREKECVCVGEREWDEREWGESVGR